MTQERTLWAYSDKAWIQYVVLQREKSFFQYYLSQLVCCEEWYNFELLLWIGVKSLTYRPSSSRYSMQYSAPEETNIIAFFQLGMDDSYDAGNFFAQYMDKEERYHIILFYSHINNQKKFLFTKYGWILVPKFFSSETLQSSNCFFSPQSPCFC